MRSLKNRPASAGGVSTDQKQALRLISEVSDLMNCTELPGSLVKDPHMKIGIPREMHADETRVARTPSLVTLLCKDGHEVFVGTSAGSTAHFTDAQYVKVGAQILGDAKSLYAQSDVIFKVLPPEMNAQTQCHETALMHEGTVCISFLVPLMQADLIGMLALADYRRPQ